MRAVLDDGVADAAVAKAARRGADVESELQRVSRLERTFEQKDAVKELLVGQPSRPTRSNVMAAVSTPGAVATWIALDRRARAVHRARYVPRNLGRSPVGMNLDAQFGATIAAAGCGGPAVAALVLRLACGRGRRAEYAFSTLVL